jgi:hypothetical protein
MATIMVYSENYLRAEIPGLCEKLPMLLTVMEESLHLPDVEGINEGQRLFYQQILLEAGVHIRVGLVLIFHRGSRQSY